MPAYQIRLPQAFTSPKQLITRRACDDEVLCKVDAPNTVEPADERFARRSIDAREDRTDKERPEPLLVQTRADHVGKCLG